MKVSFKIFLYLIVPVCLLLSAGTTPYAQNFDSQATIPAPAEIRLPEPAKLEKLKADKDFQYFEEVVEGETFWEQMKRKLAEWLRNTFYQDKSGDFWEVVLYILLAVAIVFIILKLLKVDATGLFSRKAKSAEIPYNVFEENIHELDLATLIEEAVTQHEYRKAIRLHYLQSLKKLTDANYINWKAGKTNRSYIAEIQQKQIRQEFEQLTGMFEYVWYGGAGLGAELYQNAQQEFSQFNNLLKQHV